MTDEGAISGDWPLGLCGTGGGEDRHGLLDADGKFGANGKPHCGHCCAVAGTLTPHSGHPITDTRPSSGSRVPRVKRSSRRLRRPSPACRRDTGAAGHLPTSHQLPRPGRDEGELVAKRPIWGGDRPNRGPRIRHGSLAEVRFDSCAPWRCDDKRR